MMRIISSLENLYIPEETAVAIGKFDGLHLGHKQLVNNIKKQKENGLSSVIFTFDPAPSVFFSGMRQKELLTKQEKEELFQNLGMDYLIEFPTCEKTVTISPEKFLEEILGKQLHMRYITAGTDLSFGDKGRGDVRLLNAYREQLGFETQIVDKLRYEEREISSTYVKEAVEEGDMPKVSKLLGQYYSVSGKVIHGEALGRTKNTPTANIWPDEWKLLPPFGVYATYTTVDGIRYPGVSNIGRKPTIGDNLMIGVETHLFDIEVPMYDKDIKVEFVAYLRPERRFESIEALFAQIENDKQNARKALQTGGLVL